MGILPPAPRALARHSAAVGVDDPSQPGARRSAAINPPVALDFGEVIHDAPRASTAIFIALHVAPPSQGVGGAAMCMEQPADERVQQHRRGVRLSRSSCGATARARQRLLALLRFSDSRSRDLWRRHSPPSDRACRGTRPRTGRAMSRSGYDVRPRRVRRKMAVKA